jgi:FMN phosphatase YigB (HAD superfamily)
MAALAAASSDQELLMTDAILPHALPSALDGYPGVRVLSLDCFDTLLWRDSHAPTDLFAQLPGITPVQRRRAEHRARSSAEYGRNRHDVTIAEIYAQLLPNASAAERQAAIAAELEAEARHCYAFAPTVELMRRAKAAGLQVIVVSDTYLDALQLRALILQSAGAEIAGMIDKIFCSSAFAKTKSRGLYGDVLRKLSAKPHEILHIGDNSTADVKGVAPFGVNALHLKQFSEVAERRFRHEAAISELFHVGAAGDAAALLPHRAALALAEPLAADPAEALGLTVMGPALYGFQRWLEAEAAQLEQQGGGRVHWLFVMRDGHLPKLVHEASGQTGHAIEISRFTSTAASFRRDGEALHYLECELGTRPQTLARQVLMLDAEIGRLMDRLSPSDASFALLREMRTAPRRRATVQASRAFAKRLVAHVRATVNPAPGDTLMLIDLGYNGSVQNSIDDLLRSELGVHVAGRYLLLCEKDCPGLDKRGFIGLDDYDEQSLRTMVQNVTMLEQICTTAIGSVIDYEEDGTAIRKAVDIKGAQSVTREKIQQGCLRFAEAQRGAVIRKDLAGEISSWRKGAVAVLGRVMYLPLPHELAVVERFQHDANLGTERTVALFDPAFAEQGLRQRGLFYLNGSERLYLPAELTGQGLAPKLTLLANRRFGLPFKFADFSDASITLPVIYIAGEELVQQSVEARATHDGYYLAAVPIGDCRFSVALQFGSEYEYVQIDSANAVPVAAFLDDEIREDAAQVPVATTAEAMQQLSIDLYRCNDEGGFLMIEPPARIDDTPMMVAVVFRPIAAWPSKAAQGAAKTNVQPLGVAA